MVVWMPPKCPAWRPNCLAIWVQQVQLGSAASLGGRSVMSGNIFNSNGIHVGVMEGAAIFDLKGRKLYNLKGVNIYRLSGELVGHLNGAQGSDKRLDVPPTGYSPPEAVLETLPCREKANYKPRHSCLPCLYGRMIRLSGRPGLMPNLTDRPASIRQAQVFGGHHE